MRGKNSDHLSIQHSIQDAKASNGAHIIFFMFLTFDELYCRFLGAANDWSLSRAKSKPIAGAD